MDAEQAVAQAFDAAEAALAGVRVDSSITELLDGYWLLAQATGRAEGTANTLAGCGFALAADIPIRAARLEANLADLAGQLRERFAD